jgi:hypothetical protein
MARTYHIDIARFAADAPLKWVDNLLTAHPLKGVESGRRGVARRISVAAIYHIALVHQLNHDLGVSVDTAVSIAHRLLSGTVNHLEISGHLELRFDRFTFQHEIDRRIADAVEAIVPARRGRPRGRS